MILYGIIALVGHIHIYYSTKLFFFKQRKYILFAFSALVFSAEICYNIYSTKERGLVFLKKTVQKQKPISGYPLEVRFTDDGYRLTWDTRLRMSAFEYRFFCEYAKDKYMALLYFGAMSAQKFATRLRPCAFCTILPLTF